MAREFIGAVDLGCDGRDALIGEGLVRAKGRTPSGARIYVWDPIINRSDDSQRSAS
jgi:hypothetical protein